MLSMLTNIPRDGSNPVHVLRSEKYVKTTCSSVGSGRHYEQERTPDHFAGTPPQDDNVLYVNGEVPPKGSQRWNFITNALQMIDVA
jgi:hypothetical protein